MDHSTSTNLQRPPSEPLLFYSARGTPRSLRAPRRVRSSPPGIAGCQAGDALAGENISGRTAAAARTGSTTSSAADLPTDPPPA
ncbi:MAG: hypothetical protein ABL997_00670 [Planctomycetota bacterium]